MSLNEIKISAPGLMIVKDWFSKCKEKLGVILDVCILQSGNY
jgi:hypothetical protein